MLLTPFLQMPHGYIPESSTWPLLTLLLLLLPIQLVLLALFRQRTINPRTIQSILMQGRRALDVYWKAKRNSSVLRSVLNVLIEVASLVDELRRFQMVVIDFRNEMWRRCCPSDLRFRDGCVQHTVEIGWLLRRSHVECVILCWIRSQFSCLSKGFELEFHAAWSTTCVRSFCTRWSLPIWRDLTWTLDKNKGDHLGGFESQTS